MDGRARCETCLKSGAKRPMPALYPDGKCHNHSSDPLAQAKRAEKGAKGKAEALARKEKRIAGPKKGRGVSAADAPEPAPRVGRSPHIDYSTPDAVTGTLERITAAILNGDVEPDAGLAAVRCAEVAQKIRAPRGAGGGKGDGKQKIRRVEFEVVGGDEQQAAGPVH